MNIQTNFNSSIELTYTGRGVEFHEISNAVNSARENDVAGGLFRQSYADLCRCMGEFKIAMRDSINNLTVGLNLFSKVAVAASIAVMIVLVGMVILM